MSVALRERFARDKSGSVLLASALLMAVLMSVIGLTVTFALATHERSDHQDALDAAVLAGASALNVDDAERIALANKVFEANIQKSALSKTASADFKSQSLVPQFVLSDVTLTGRVEADVKNYFSGFIGEKAVKVVVGSAARVASSEPVCVLSLDNASSRGLEIYGTAQFTARNCAAQANSRDGAGMKTYGNATAKARKFGVKGGFSGTGFQPKPVVGVQEIIDPYASIPIPASGACVDIASKLQHTPAVLVPGTYCGGIRIMANSKIIMLPGEYLMLDGPFRVDSNSTVDGSEVVIAFKGKDSTMYLGSGAIINLTSPMSGTYQNIQFLQDKSSSVDGWVTVMGNVKLRFDGVMYFPTQHVWIGGGSVVQARSPTYIFVAEKIWLQDNSIIDVWQENSRNLKIDEAPALLTEQARLIQ